MNTDDKKVSLEIPLNTQMKIFAFLFKENYSMSELFSGTREVGYYGESQSFSIGTQTNNLSLGITLKAASGNEDASTGGGDDSGNDGGSGDYGNTDTTAPVIETVTAVTTPTSDSTPVYTFSSTETGSITYGGPCATSGSATTNAIVGHNLIIFNTLSIGTYSNCTIKVTDSAGNESNTLTITTFTVLPDGLIAYYPFDGNANAKIGTLNGTVSGATLSTGRNNESNTAYSFDGVDDYIEFGAGMLSGDGEFSILIWINTSSGSFARILSQRNGGYNGQYIVELESDGEIEFYTYSSLTGKWIVRSSSALNDGNWHHLAFVQQDNGGKMYLNGSLDQTDNLNGKVNLLSTNKTYLGKDGRNNSSFYTGKVDDLKIYNRALSASEIQTLFNTSD